MKAIYIYLCEVCLVIAFACGVFGYWNVMLLVITEMIRVLQEKKITECFLWIILILMIVANVIY
jgi:hypothetical protein